MENISFVQDRARLLHSIRDYFHQESFLEVQTRVCVEAPLMEMYTDAIPAGDAYLRPSPEIQMKRMLAAGFHKIYELGPCFRAKETSSLHSPEFTMLEWYRAFADYHQILADIKKLLCYCAENLNGESVMWARGGAVNLNGRWLRMTVDQAFEAYAHCSVDDAVEQDLFELYLSDRVLPAMPADIPCVLYDFPAALGGLARRSSANKDRLERWELFVQGVEVANAYNELVDHQEQQAVSALVKQMREKRGAPVYPVDPEYACIIEEAQLPESAGVALGVDRLLMLMIGASDVTQVIPFSNDSNSAR
jgi:lysyl-tRNA synthetase class 2